MLMTSSIRLFTSIHKHDVSFFDHTDKQEGIQENMLMEYKAAKEANEYKGYI